MPASEEPPQATTARTALPARWGRAGGCVGDGRSRAGSRGRRSKAGRWLPSRATALRCSGPAYRVFGKASLTLFGASPVAKSRPRTSHRCRVCRPGAHARSHAGGLDHPDLRARHAGAPLEHGGEHGHSDAEHGQSGTEPTGIGSGADGHAVRADLPAAQPAWPPRTPTAPTTPLPVATADPEPAAYLPDDVPSAPPLFDPTGPRPGAGAGARPRALAPLRAAAAGG